MTEQEREKFRLAAFSTESGYFYLHLLSCKKTEMWAPATRNSKKGNYHGMATPQDRRKNKLASTYFVQDQRSKQELTRLTIQDCMVTAAMGGVLPEQTDPASFHRVLDVACGPGGWAIDAAQAYPEMSLVGIDISDHMIKYACEQAEVHHVTDQVEFRVMDTLRPLAFPDASFDLVNLRFGISFVRTWDWPKLLGELLRVTHPGGCVRLTDQNVLHQNNSPALTRLFEIGVCTLFNAGHLFAPGDTGLTAYLAPLLKQWGCQQVQTKTFALAFQAGTVEGQAYYEDMMRLFSVGLPFAQKWGCASGDYDVIYQQALNEMQQSDFHSTWNLLTVRGYVPG